MIVTKNVQGLTVTCVFFSRLLTTSLPETCSNVKRQHRVYFVAVWDYLLHFAEVIIFISLVMAKNLHYSVCSVFFFDLES